MTPTIVLINPKFPENLACAVRAAAAFGFERVVFTGERCLDQMRHADRTPRELRMREYRHVRVAHSDRPFDLLTGLTFTDDQLRDAWKRSYEIMPHRSEPERQYLLARFVAARVCDPRAEGAD